MNEATAALLDSTFPSKAAAFKALRAAGGVNYLDPCSHKGIGSGEMKALRNVFQLPCGTIIGVNKRRGCPARLTDETAYRRVWAGSICASTAQKCRDGEVTTFYAG